MNAIRRPREGLLPPRSRLESGGEDRGGGCFLHRLIIRAHQVMDNGYGFFAGRKLVTVFSASNYCGEFTNLGAMLLMDGDLRCKFNIFKPDYNAAAASLNA